MAIFVVHRRVEFAETDAAGIVYFANYFRFMEAAEHTYLRSLGITMHDPDGVGWPRVSCQFDYRAPLRFDDAFEVRLRIHRIGRSSLTYRSEIVRGDTVCAVGSSTNACCRFRPDGSIKSVAIPPAIRQKLEAAKRARR